MSHTLNTKNEEMSSMISELDTLRRAMVDAAQVQSELNALKFERDELLIKLGSAQASATQSLIDAKSGGSLLYHIFYHHFQDIL